MPGELERLLSQPAAPMLKAYSGNFSANRQIARQENQGLARAHQAHVDGSVAAVKLTEIDRLARVAMSGQLMLNRWALTLAEGDPMAVDDLRFFSDIAKMGKGELIANTINTFAGQARFGR